MARFDLIDMDYEPDEYVVQRDDGSCYKRFKNYSEARDYYNYLQQFDDQRKSVKQNDKIIANQKRLLEMQAQNNRMPNRPIVTRQVLDPEYQEWLQFKKETDPAYLKWGKKVEREAAERARKQKEHAAEALGMDKDKLMKLASAFNNGLCSVKTNKGIAWRINKSQFYTFTSVYVIQDILDIIDSQENFRIFWDQYKSHTDIIIKSASLRFADRAIISQLLQEYWQEEGSVNLIIKNAGWS